jgi:hypothetical protein
MRATFRLVCVIAAVLAFSGCASVQKKFHIGVEIDNPDKACIVADSGKWGVKPRVSITGVDGRVYSGMNEVCLSPGRHNLYLNMAAFSPWYAAGSFSHYCPMFAPDVEFMSGGRYAFSVDLKISEGKCIGTLIDSKSDQVVFLEERVSSWEFNRSESTGTEFLVLPHWDNRLPASHQKDEKALRAPPDGRRNESSQLLNGPLKPATSKGSARASWSRVKPPLGRSAAMRIAFLRLPVVISQRETPP